MLAARQDPFVRSEICNLPRIDYQKLVAVLLVVHAGLLAYGASVHSPTMNELSHLASGICHWQFRRFDLYRVNPPLVRMTASLPVLIAGVNADWRHFDEHPGARSEFSVDSELVATNGTRTLFLLVLARWACIPFSLLGLWVCFCWSRDLFGANAGLLAAAMWCFEPNILAHGELITPDVGATALAFAAIYGFWRWLRHPTWRAAFITGITLGLAELCKTTLLILYPLWPLMWALYRLPELHAMPLRRWLREASMLTTQLAISLYLLNLLYAFDGSGTPLRDFTFISAALKGTTNEQTGNRFTVGWLGCIPIPLPKDYVLGLDIQKSNFEHYGAPSYLRGEWRSTGWWYYYLYALAIKVPLGITGLLFLSLLYRALMQLLSRRYVIPARPRDAYLLLLPPLLIFACVSSQTGFSKHMRYVLPIFPFAFVWASQLGGIRARKCTQKPEVVNADSSFHPSRYHLPDEFMVMIRRVFSLSAAALLLWSTCSSLCVYPHSLSYFNESIGGPAEGAKHLLGSNFDWGQDLLYLKRWLDQNRDKHPVYLAYYGCIDPVLVGIEGFVAPPASFDVYEARRRKPGWYAISVVFVRGLPGYPQGEPAEAPAYTRDSFIQLRDVRPYAKVAETMYVFKLAE